MDKLIETGKEYLKNILSKQYEASTVEKIFSGYYSKRAVTLRINTLKIDCTDAQNELRKNNIEYEILPWSKTAIIVKNKTEQDLQKLKLYENGHIYLQSLSSMLPPIIMEPQKGEDILDMASAPGGKTTQIATITNNEAHITACEMNKIRAEKLMYNIEKQGASSVYVMCKDARQLDNFFSFDRILLDAPCSGSGILNLNNENTFKYFTPRLVEKTSKTQSELLNKAINLIKKGKEIVYSTCSILECENENIIYKALKTGKVEIVPINFQGIENIPQLPTKLNGTLCVCPNELYEGFFVAKLRKK